MSDDFDYEAAIAPYDEVMSENYAQRVDLMPSEDLKHYFQIHNLPSQAKPSQAKPSQAKPSQAKPREAIRIESYVQMGRISVHGFERGAESF